VFHYLRGAELEAIREGRWKLRLSRHLRGDLKKDEPISPELFDLETDPGERHNLAARNPELVERLRGALARFRKDLQPRREEL
jgi:arylsulfatase A-like enzyme